MKLTRLELSGFKSFADTVTLTFEQGVTAIVGPNGCGKSNVSDAVRWVLGEQSARLLRGGKMEDVIFQGSTGRRPVNVTEVSLFLDNTDGDLPIMDLTRVSVAADLEPLGETDSRDKRPAQTVFGAVVALSRGGLFALLGLVVGAAAVLGVTTSEVTADVTADVVAGTGLALVLLLAAAVDVVLGLAVLRGRNWARMLLMLYSAFAIVTAFIANVTGSERISLQTNLLTVGLSILVLLALTSHRARDFAHRGRPMHKQLAVGSAADG